MKTSFSLLLPVSFLLSACAVGPDYVRPETPTAGVFPEATPGGVAVGEKWWQGFGDAQLSAFVEQALLANVDVRIAAGRVEEAAAGLADVAGARLPQVDASAGAAQSKVSDNGYTPISSTNGRNRTVYRAGLATSFELDFWGKLRRATEAARAQLLATTEARTQVELAVAASVVRAYALAQSAAVQQRSAEELVAIRTEERRIVGARFAVGSANASDRAQAEVNVAAAVATLSDARRVRANAEHLLGFLVGRPDLVLPTAGSVALVPPPPAAGLPVDLLRRRPDVLAAEQALVAANARIGYVKATYLPSFTLTGALGSESRDLAQLFTAASATSSLGVDLRAPVFDFGRGAARVEGAVALQHQAAATYEKAVLTAFREVRDALSDVRETIESARAAELREASAQEAFRVAEARRAVGQLPLAEHLLARRLLAESTAAVARVRHDRIGAQVDLIKALGGARVEVPAK
jgi:multidrug efflux system outer membrane protein